MSPFTPSVQTFHRDNVHAHIPMHRDLESLLHCWRACNSNALNIKAESNCSFSALLSVPIFHFPVSRPVLDQRYLACEQALLFGRAKRAARGVASPFACHSGVYFSQYHPNRELGRRLNATRPPFQSSQTQKQHVT